MELFNLISLAVIFGVAMLLLYRQGIFRDKALLVCALVLTAAAMLIRGFYFDVQSDDYTTFLAPWTQFFRDNGGFKALAFFPGNYNVLSRGVFVFRHLGAVSYKAAVCSV